MIPTFQNPDESVSIQSEHFPPKYEFQHKIQGFFFFFFKNFLNFNNL